METAASGHTAGHSPVASFLTRTVGQKMREAGRSTGFDYLRLGLALAIIIWHIIPVDYGQDYELAIWHGPAGVAMHFVLPMFFALSGFLVAGSLDRAPTLITFFALRVLRIVPALTVEVTLSAFVLGPLLSTMSVAGYLQDEQLPRYLLNIVGDIHYTLPGVFLTNPFPNIVNAQLWTIPFELQCYLALGGLAAAWLFRRRWIILLGVLLAQGLWAAQAIKLAHIPSSGGASGPVLVVAFLTGILAHLYRDKIPFHTALFIGMAMLGAVLSALPHGAYFLPFPATYLTVWLGLQKPRAIALVATGDYSYGLYLYGYPLQQAVANAGPAFQHWWINLGLALPAAFGVAYVSWHTIERPALALRKHLPKLEGSLAALLDRCLDTWPMNKYHPKSHLVVSGLNALCGLTGVALLVDAHEGLAVIVIALTFIIRLTSKL